VADLPPVEFLNQWMMSPKDSEREIPVIVLLESKLEKHMKYLFCPLTSIRSINICFLNLQKFEDF